MVSLFFSSLLSTVAGVVDALPKTRSGKSKHYRSFTVLITYTVLRGVMKKIADGEEFKVDATHYKSIAFHADLLQFPATIDDPEALKAATSTLHSLGFPRK